MTNRIDAKLREVRASAGTALGFFITVGFPNVDTSMRVSAAVLDSGADFVELGVPFSDPLAEGPTIQRTSFQALQQGVNVSKCIDVVRRLRAQGVDGPLLFMGYYNPYLRYGLERFVKDAAYSGVDGLIVPDLPTEESGPFRQLCEGHDIHLVPLLAPTSTNERIAEACRHARGFIYCVSIAGITGARTSLHSGIAGFVGRVRRHTELPVLVGFGVSSREHVEEIGKFADGAIIGSALLDAIDRVPEERAVQTAKEFVKKLRGV